MVVIPCDDIVLRTCKAEDLKAITKHLQNPLVAQGSPCIPSPYKLSDAKEWFEQSQRYEAPHVFAITQNDILLGIIELKNHRALKAELGYWLAPEAWGKGIATRVVREMLRYGFSQLDIHRIYAGVIEGNEASENVLLKTGFQYEGTMRDNHFHHGKMMDTRLFSILSTDMVWHSRSEIETHYTNTAATRSI